MKILVNTISTKKNSGGAFQIACNFLAKTLEHPEINWIYVVSADLDEVLPDKIKSLAGYYVFPTQPDYAHTYLSVRKELRMLENRTSPDVVYSITAPSYFTFKSKEVMRFTMPWVTHPNRYSWSVLSWKGRMKMRLYCWNQRRMMKKTQFFITQSETTRRGIIRITGTRPEDVRVVPNVLPAVFHTLENNPYPPEEGWIDIASVANTSAHKNLDILPAVLKELLSLGINNVRFHVTIPKESSCWDRIQKELQLLGLENRIVTHGRCSQIDLAEMYRHCQLCFLPTLLEVFSASTLEAMYFGLPVVATDFDFNREVMGDACLYYEPKNAHEAAERIKDYIDNPDLQRKIKERMPQRLRLFQDYDRHFDGICDFLKEVAGKE